MVVKHKFFFSQRGVRKLYCLQVFFSLGRGQAMVSEGPEVYGLGQCSLDYLGRIEAWPPPDVKCEFTDLTVQGGGPVATALVALSRWGVSCSFAGIVGDDAFGGQIVDSLRREGVDTGGVVVRGGENSQFAFAAAEGGSGRRTIFWRRPTGAPLQTGEVDVKRLRSSRFFLTDGLMIEASLAAAREARAAGIPVVVDAGSLREGMPDLARESDYFLASSAFACAFMGDAALEKVCRRLAELGPKVTGVTLGEKGYAALVEGRYIERPAYPVEAVDTTGCGDVFHGGFVYGLVKGWEVERCLDFGAWAAAMVSRRLGGRAGIPPADEYGVSP
jgi:sulfofructose kinase